MSFDREITYRFSPDQPPLKVGMNFVTSNDLAECWHWHIEGRGVGGSVWIPATGHTYLELAATVFEKIDYWLTFG